MPGQYRREKRKAAIQVDQAPEGGCLRQCRRGKRKAATKVDWTPQRGCLRQCRRGKIRATLKVRHKSRPGARGGIARTIQKGKKNRRP